MKRPVLIFILFLSGGILWAQETETAQIPPADAIQNYLTATKEYAALFNGKIETPFDSRQFVNHAYLGTDQYTKGSLCYNQVVYRDVYLRLDLYRDEMTVYSPDKPYHIVLDKEKFNYAEINGFTVVTSIYETETGEKYRLLIDNGIYPFVKQYRVTVKNELSNIDVRRHFLFQEQYFIYINGVLSPVKNKNSLLRLFPDRKKELNEYARQHKLNFKAKFEQSVVALVNHYETMNSD